MQCVVYRVVAQHDPCELFDRKRNVARKKIKRTLRRHFDVLPLRVHHPYIHRHILRALARVRASTAVDGIDNNV